jgi:hypothetical protein
VVRLGNEKYHSRNKGVHDRISLVIKLSCIISIVLLVQGCPSKAPPGVRFPITSGSHAILPMAQQRILIWGDPPLLDVAVEWLRAHHYSNILIPDKSPFQGISHSFSNRKAALAVGREMKAEIVLFLEREATKEGTLIESHCGPLFNVSVHVRGLSVESGETVLRGSAHYPHCVDLSGNTFRSLTCQAFATAWGFRPTGQLDIPSNLMCTAGQTEPTPIR